MRMASADRLSAIVFFSLGLALLVGGWTMDRLEIRQIHPASIPGLVPIILGILLALCAVLLFRASYANANEDEPEFIHFGSWTRLALTGALCTGYAIGLVGWLSYFWATAIFTFAFSLVFSYPVNGDQRSKLVAAAGALVLGLAVSFGSSILFRELFLVRLP
ncbi:MAG: tripartite tricarboxylate transporter TctB family protein [Pseudomonadota bacterium]